MEHTRIEKRLHRITLVAAFFCFAVSIADMLNIIPGIGGKMMPLLIGILILYLLPLGQSVNRTRRNAAAIQQKMESLRHNVRQINQKDKKAAKRVERYPETRAPDYHAIKWHGLSFRSKSELKIAKELDRSGALFLSNCKIRLKSETHRQSREVDFLVCHEGKWGILEVDGPHHANSAEADSWRDDRFLEHGIRVSRYPASACYQTPAEVVTTFLAQLDKPNRSPSGDRPAAPNPDFAT